MIKPVQSLQAERDFSLWREEFSMIPDPLLKPKRRHAWMRWMVILPTLFLAFPMPARAADIAFSYADSRSLITLEFTSRNQAILNYFNLSPYIVGLKAQNLWVVDESGAVYIGQVLKAEESMPEEDAYIGSVMIKPWTYTASEVWGVFSDPAQVQQVHLLMGGKRLAMKKTEPSEMEELAARIEGADLSLKDGPTILKRTNISPRGRLTYPTGEQDELEIAVSRMLGPEELNPPRILSRVNPTLTEEARKAGVQSVQLKLSVSLGKNGEIQEIKVVKGGEYGLEERAISTIRNSWKFLPATQHSETVATVMTLNVTFQSP